MDKAGGRPQKMTEWKGSDFVLRYLQFQEWS